jgi:hypothetical protein
MHRARGDKGGQVTARQGKVEQEKGNVGTGRERRDEMGLRVR